MGDEEVGARQAQAGVRVGRHEGPAREAGRLRVGASAGRRKRGSAQARVGASAGRYGSAPADRVDAGATPNVYRDRNVGI